MNPSRALFLRIAALVLGSLSFVLPVAASAADVTPAGANSWTIYAFANGTILYNLLMAAKGLVQSSGYWYMVLFFALLSVLTVSVAAAHRHDGMKKLLGVFILITLLMSVGLKSTATVTVVDTVTNYSTTVTGVPLLVAMPEAVISSAGHELTRILEKFYSTPTSLNVGGGGGFNLANSMVQASTKVTVTDPMARSTIASFTQNCIIPGIARGSISAHNLMNATDLWAANGPMAGIPQSALTPVYTSTQPGGILLPCGPNGVGSAPQTAIDDTGNQQVSAPDALDYIRNYFQAHAPSWLAQDASTYTSTSAFSWLSATMTSAQSFLFGGAMQQSAGQSIGQAAAINALRPALNAAGVASGNSQAVTALAVSQAETSQISSWGTAAVIFRDMAGYIYSVLQAFMMALMPVLIVAAFIPGAGKKLVISSGQVMIWLALWEPTLSLVNYIIDLYSQGELGPALGSTGGYSMQNIGAVDVMTSHLTLAAGFLASMVPLITWGLVKGGIAFTEFLTGGIGSALAKQAGAEAATGNVSLDNQSYGGRTVDQEMLKFQESVGVGQAENTMAGVSPNTSMHNGRVMEYAGNTALSTAAAAQGQRNHSTATTISNQASHSSQSSENTALSLSSQNNRQVLSTLQQQASQGSTQTATQAKQHLQQLDESYASSMLTAIHDGASAEQVLQRMAKAGVGVSNLASGLLGLAGKGNKEAEAVASSLGGKLGKIAGGVIGSVKGNGDLSGALNANVKADSSASKDRKNSHDYSGKTSNSYTQQAALAKMTATVISETSQYSDVLGQTAQASYQHAEAFAQQAVKSAQRAQTAQELSSESTTLSGNLNFDSIASGEKAYARLTRIGEKLKALRDANIGAENAGVGSAYADAQGSDGQQARLSGNEAQADGQGVVNTVNKRVGQANKAVADMAASEKAVSDKGKAIAEQRQSEAQNIGGTVDASSKAIGGHLHQEGGKTQSEYTARAGSDQHAIHNPIRTLALGGMPNPSDGSGSFYGSQLELAGSGALLSTIQTAGQIMASGKTAETLGQIKNFLTGSGAEGAASGAEEAAATRGVGLLAGATVTGVALLVTPSELGGNDGNPNFNTNSAGNINQSFMKKAHANYEAQRTSRTESDPSNPSLAAVGHAGIGASLLEPTHIQMPN